MKASTKQLLYFGLAAHLIAAFFSVGVHHADELYQVFEFAGYKLGINPAGILPWEFHEKMRSGLQPFSVFILTKILAYVNITNPFRVATMTRILISLFSFAVSVRVILVFEKELKEEIYRKSLWFLGILFWLLPYFHARYSSENVSASLFVLAMLLLYEQKEKKTFLVYVIGGILCGFSFLVRFQLGFMVAGLFLWLILIKRENLSFMISLCLGFVFALITGLVVDRWFYGSWTLSWWNYVDMNFFKDMAGKNFGTQPWYFYFSESVMQLIPPFSIVLIASLIAFWYYFPGHIITWVTLPFVLLHFFVGHKETRFLMPVLDFMPVMLLMTFGNGLNHSGRLYQYLTNRFIVRLAVLVNLFALLLVCIKPADHSSEALQNIYEKVNGEKPVIFYNGNDPYDMFSLNYFRNTTIQTEPVDVDAKVLQSSNWYYFSEEMIQPRVMILNKRAFYRIYTNFPDWIKYLNFNGWLDRAGRYSIYKAVS